MAILLLILKILLGILGVLLLLLLLALCGSVAVRVEQGEELSVWVGFFGFSRRVLPEGPEKKGTPREKPAKEGPETPEEGDNAPPGLAEKLKTSLLRDARAVEFSEALELVLEALRDVFDPTGRILGRVRIRRLKLELSVGAADAAQTALRYAELSAAVYNLLALLQQKLSVKVSHVRVDANFTSGKIEARYSFVAKLRLGTVVWQLLRLGGGLWHTRKKLGAAAKRASEGKDEAYGSYN